MGDVLDELFDVALRQAVRGTVSTTRTGCQSTVALADAADVSD